LLPTRFHPGTTPRQGKDVVAFAERVAKAGSADFVPVPERIAVFDNDGVLRLRDWKILILVREEVIEPVRRYIMLFEHNVSMT
jgi:hypothetical protein